MINPILIIAILLVVITFSFILAFAFMKDKKEAIGFDRNMKDSGIIKRLLKYAKPYIKNFIIVLLLMAFTVASDIVLPLIIGKITAILGEDDFKYKTILLYVLGYVSILLLSLISGYFQAIILQKTGQRIISTMREETFEHIEYLAQNDLNHIPVGKLVTRVCNDTGTIQYMFTSIIVNLFKNVCMIIGVLVAMLLVNVKLTVVVVSFVPFVIIFTYIFRKFSRKAYRGVRNAITDINTFLSENLSGIKVTQIFNQENKKLNDFKKKNKALAKNRLNQIFSFSIFRPFIYLLYISTMIVLFFVASNEVIDPTNKAWFNQVITYDTVVIFYQYISTFFNPIQSLADQFNVMQSAFAAAEKVFTINDMEIAIKDKEDAIELENIKGKIEFRNVWFAYVDEEWILKDVSFTVNAKETVAFVGSTGAGKSTILNLIVRNYDIQKGQILIDDIDIKDIKISSLRKHFGQMLQDVFIFSGTVKSNIVLKDETMSDEKVMEACKYVNANSFIDKYENGIYEEIKERGNNLSAGQRQLISFARTIIHEPEVMILDEATANIDTETEVLIQDSLEKMKTIGTMLIVAHRLSTIQHANKIIVLSHGQIIEQGTHQELLKLKGAYFKLYELQYNKELLSKN